MDIGFLYVCNDIRDKIRCHAMRLTELNELITALNSQLDGLPRAQSVASKVERLAASIVDERKAIEDLKIILASCKLELAEMLSRFLPGNDNVRRVIFYRYGEGKYFYSVSNDLKFSERQIYNYHSAGIRQLKKLQ